MREVAGLQKSAEPHAVESEQMVLGALLLGANVPTIAAAGGRDLFFDPVHQDIFTSIAARQAVGEVVDVSIMMGALREHPGLAALGGPRYLARLATSTILASVGAQTDFLVDALHRRRILAAVRAAEQQIAGPDPATIVARQLEAALMTAAPASGTTKPISMAAAVSEAVDQICAAYAGTGLAPLRSGIAALDSFVPGLFPGELILLGGRPSMGKTAVALAIALNAAQAGRSVVISSLEMTADSIALRAISNASANNAGSIPYSRMRRGDLSEAELRRLLELSSDVGNLPIWILPPFVSEVASIAGAVRSIARTLTAPLGLLVIDYLQLMKGSGAKNRFEEITSISIACKGLARELGVPVLALSQLSRSLEGREDKRPMLSDLRESGQLEQDADTVLFVYRDEFYLEREMPPSENLEAMAAWQAAMERAHNRLEIIVAKQRQGPTGTARVRFNPATNIVWEETH